MEVGRSAVNNLIHEHYLHRWPGVVVSILALVDGYSVIGCVVFALPPKETMTRYNVPLAWELARLYLIDEAPKNSETWLVAKAIKWVKTHRPDVKLIVSYADPSAGHQGIIYQAGNWIKDGRTDDERKSARCDYLDPETGKIYSRRNHADESVKVVRVPRISKFRYIYWLDGKHEKRRQESYATRD